MSNMLKLSPLPRTWVFDLDGTLVKHNGYKIDGQDTLLDGVKEFFSTFSMDDYVLIVTARKSEFKQQTIDFLADQGIRYNQIIFDLPSGERILVNDKKPSGLYTAYAVNLERDQFKTIQYEVDESL